MSIAWSLRIVINILICGDSFAADWTVKYPTGQGWPNLLANEFSVTNCSQAGCSEFKILKQIQNQDLHKYTHLVIAHTSPNRIPVITHPIHHNDLLHANADLIYNDICYHADKNPNVKSIVDYFEKYFDLEYAEYCYNRILAHIDEILLGFPDLKILHVTNLSLPATYSMRTGQQRNYYHLAIKNKGLHNHFNEYANQLVYQEIKEFLHE